MSQTHRTKKKDLRLFRYLSVAMMALPLAIAGYNLVPLRWPKTSGRILESRVEYESPHDNPALKSVAYLVRVRYTYDVDGRTYSGNRVWRTMNIDPLLAGRARGIAARYRPGRVVEVRYNPDDPAEAVLEARVPPEVMALCRVRRIVPPLYRDHTKRIPHAAGQAVAMELESGVGGTGSVARAAELDPVSRISCYEKGRPKQAGPRRPRPMAAVE